jgi:hypothetical protein
MMLVARGATAPVLLVDPRDPTAAEHFRAGWQGPARCVAGAATPRATVALMRDLARQDCVDADDLVAFARELWPQARTAVAAPPDDYEWWLRAAAFAGATGSALLPVGDPEIGAPPFTGLRFDRVYLFGAARVWRDAARAVAASVLEPTTADESVAMLVDALGARPRTLVVANARDREGIFSPSSLSLVAPLLSAAHRAPLLLVGGRTAAAIEAEVQTLLERHGLAPTHIVLVGDELALESHRVPDPVLAAGGPEARGGGTEVRVELFSELQNDAPQDFVVGRIVAEDAAQASAVLARRFAGARADKKRPVVFFTNADGVFQLGEAISRTTVAELRNVGVPVRAYYGAEIDEKLIRRSLAATDVLVWEGHARDLTLEERGGIAATAAPGFVFLQGCYTFDRSDPFILMEKGTFAIVGTSTAVYSAPGSALARAFFDAVLYERADLGTATRNARNFLLALSRLQRERGHDDWRKTYRAALAFALWGDPTLVLDLQPGRPAVPPLEWTLADGMLTLAVPTRALGAVTVGPYRAEPPARAMLGGLLLRAAPDEPRRVKELYFAVRDGNDGRMACAAEKGWEVVSLYAPRTRTLTVLARPDWTIVSRPGRGGTFTFPVVAAPSACPAVPPLPVDTTSPR